jgi:hypothetical protein
LHNRAIDFVGGTHWVEAEATLLRDLFSPR